jgi:phospholipid/cholesterol/gamma-HCH transport system ATP-binding protein
METVLEVRDIVTRFGADVVHDGVSFAVQRGEVVALIGGSGTGKSVLLKEMIGLLRPTSGSVHLLGTDVCRSSEEEMNGLRRRFGMLFQDGALFSSLSVAENIAVPLREHTDLPDALIAPLVGFKLSLVGLSPDTGRKTPAELSGGMRKRVALARALALEPEILFLDEPTSGLDPIGARAFDSLVRALSDSLGLTVFMVTHDLDTLLSIIDRTIALSTGKVIADGPVAAVMRATIPGSGNTFRRARRTRKETADGTRSQIHPGRQLGAGAAGPARRRVTWLASASRGTDVQRYTIYFARQSLEGLQVRSDVRMKGIRVGAVTGFLVRATATGHGRGRDRHRPEHAGQGKHAGDRRSQPDHRAGDDPAAEHQGRTARGPAPGARRARSGDRRGRVARCSSSGKRRTSWRSAPTRRCGASTRRCRTRTRRRWPRRW